MLIAVALYLLIGSLLGWAWNRAEFGRSGIRRVAPSLSAFVLAWPLVLGFLMLVAAFWSRVWKRSHAPAPNPVTWQTPSASPPRVDPGHALTGRTAAL